MSQPSNFHDCVLRRLLFRWAARFTSDERTQNRLVEKTIADILRVFPITDDDAKIDVELLATLRRVAFEEFGAHPRQDAKRHSEDHPVSNQNQ
jgi:predicted nucleic acid-binding protein